ncbi:YALI0A11077p [Yarrowia lipolytica CLIB122]|uniref:YALI0A11077p n=2 Tax=Yarrowia lipolytica TaxID=4952 RepID=Q6CH94_YARLI|nr:YALI0A11077p [Yarrowia lipolytica CLIB122]RDW43057.1 glycoside hydrolase superfamily [Yarrowia lipolytica]CAG83897.1 YALI0A11077p [Yarrowia lipolytica CLIB122]|eukprot:XP_499968.1 YALI0A11077p [Yarrowia lipolytica CLIB122]
MKLSTLLAQASVVLAIGYKSHQYNSNVPYAVGYAALTDEGFCKTEQRIWEDLEDIHEQGVKAVAIEGVTCDQHQHVVRLAYGLGLKVHVSFPVTRSGLESASLQMRVFVDSFNLSPHWNAVEAVVVGNSAIKNDHAGWMDLENLTWNLKAALKNAGYGGLISIAEPAETFENFPLLCRSDTIDFVSVEVWPYYHPQYAHRDSGLLVAREILRAERACAFKSVFVTSAGYPSSGITNGNQIASRDRQEQAVNLMLAQTRGNITLQTYFNEPWREEGQFKDLQYYGMRKVIQGGYD